MPQRKPEYTPELRAAVLAKLLSGGAIKTLAREYSIPEKTLRDWREAGRKLVNDWSAPEGAGKSGPPKDWKWLDERIWNLVGTWFDTLEAVAVASQDAAWVKSQSAAALAVYAGTTTDKLLRLLAALELGGSSGQSVPGGDGGSALLPERAGEAAQPEVD